jgi:rSAM/selenodomain-associated transferase 2
VKPPFAGPSDELTVGIIVPVFNEGRSLDYYLSRLYEVTRGRCPAIVVDGRSTDGSVAIARRFFHTEISVGPNRASQMNHGAQCLSSDVLVFLHADSELPLGFDSYVRLALADEEVVGGCFRLQFDVAHPLLNMYSWFTRFPGRFLHFGDQGFFVRADVFRRMGGFAPLPFLEDVEFLKRLTKYGKFVALSASVRTSARRFLRRGIVRQQLKNIVLVALYELGVRADRLAAAYPPVR